MHVRLGIGPEKGMLPVKNRPSLFLLDFTLGNWHAQGFC